VVPQKHEIVCYECGYAFVLQGRVQKTYCPKCRTLLEMTHHVVEDTWSGSIRTIGTIEVKRGAVIEEGELTAGSIVLRGDARKGKLRACGRLELCTGGQFNVEATEIKDVLVRKGARIKVPSRIVCRNMDVEGKLNAKVFCEGALSVRPGGLIQGEVHAPHMVVEEGGGLKAKVFVSKEQHETAATGGK